MHVFINLMLQTAAMKRLRNSYNILLLFAALSMACSNETDTATTASVNEPDTVTTTRRNNSPGSINFTDKRGLRQGYWKIFGKSQRDTSYAPDAVVECGNYKHGVKSGKWVIYTPSGTIKDIVYY